jgi:hypothetical protein
MAGFELGTADTSGEDTRMFTVIHTQMKQTAYLLAGIVLLEWVLDKLDLHHHEIKSDMQTVLLVLGWIAVVAWRSVEKLAEQEKGG